MHSRLPWMKFWTDAWTRDTRILSLAARGLWLDLICLMWNSPRRGVLLSPHYRPYTEKQISQLVGAPLDEVKMLLAELEEAEIFSRTETGLICSRRMLREEEGRSVDRLRKQGERRAHKTGSEGQAEMTFEDAPGERRINGETSPVVLRDEKVMSHQVQGEQPEKPSEVLSIQQNRPELVQPVSAKRPHLRGRGRGRRRDIPLTPFSDIQRTGAEPPPEKPLTSDDFALVGDAIWSAHPAHRKTTKEDAREWLRMRCCHYPDPMQTAADIQRRHSGWCVSPEWHDKKGRFVPNLKKYLLGDENLCMVEPPDGIVTSTSPAPPPKPNGWDKAAPLTPQEEEEYRQKLGMNKKQEQKVRTTA